MNADQSKKWIDAINEAGIKAYQYDTDLGTHLYHDGVNCLAIAKDDLNAVIAIRSNQAFGGSHNTYSKNVQVVMADYADIHEVRTAGTSEEIIKLVEALGATLTESDVKVIVNIDKGNYDIKPETGNYLRFRYLTQKQYDALSDEEKAKYDSEKKAYEEKKEKYIGQNMAASITL